VSGRASVGRPQGRVSTKAARRRKFAQRRYGSGPAVDSCGCKMGARFLGVVLPVSLAWYLWRWQASDVSLLEAVAWIAGWTFAAASVGKVVGILHWRKSLRRQ
jgi:hypothetical protein